MTTPRLDPPATQHDGTPDSEHEGPEDPQTARLRDENRALRELLAAQVQASIPRPGLFKRLGWALISAPGAALVGWRSLIGREDATPITGKRVGYATLTVLYTLAIYGALVLLVVSWSTPNAARTGVNAAGPVRVPLDAPQGAGQEPASPAAATDGNSGDGAATPPKEAEPPPAPAQAPDSAPQEDDPETTAPANPADSPAARPAATAGANAAPVTARDHAPGAPKPTLRITEIPAENPLAWLDSLKTELARCASLGFFDRPDCAWAARKQYCGPNQGWGAVKECPPQP